MLKYALLAITALVIALVTTPRVRALAVRLGAIDEPGGRRIHQGRVPRLGGLAILAAFLGTLILGRLVDVWVFGVYFGHWEGWYWVLLGALIVIVAGAVDDLWHLGPAAKLVMQLLAGFMVLAGHYGVSVVTNPFTGSSVALGWLAVPVTLLWVVGVTNAFNLVDGLDGLAAGVALIASATLFVVSLSAGRVDVALLSATLAGALGGFLYYNFNPASIFLGDSGSLLLGYLLSVLSVQSAQKGATAVVILVPILALGLPIMDTLLALVRRVLGALHVVQVDTERNEYRFLVTGSASVFTADRDHIHHRLISMGLTHRRAVLFLYGVCLIFGLLAFVAVTARGVNNAFLVAAVAGTTYLSIRKLGYQEVEVFRRGALLPLFDLPVVNRRLFHAIVDASFVAAAYVVAFYLVHGVTLEESVRAYLLRSVILVVVVKLGSFVYAGVYWRTYRYTNIGDLVRLVRGLIAAQVAAVAALGVVFGFPPSALIVLILDFYLTVTLVAGTRVSFKVFEVLARGQGAAAARPVLIYGAGTGGTMLLREIEQNAALGYRAVGFVDDAPDLWGREVNGVSVLGGVDRLEEWIDRSGAREVVVASSEIDAEHITVATAACAPHGVPLRRFRITLDRMETPAENGPASAAESHAPVPSVRSH